MSAVELDQKIPNNVDLSSDKKLQRALESWLPQYLDWWMEMGPAGYQNDDIYLRTAVSVEAGGWAHFDHESLHSEERRCKQSRVESFIDIN